MRIHNFALEDLPRQLPARLDPGAVISLVASCPGIVNPSGSGVAISPHLVLTAGHVVDDYLATVRNDGPWGIQGSSALSTQHQNRTWDFKAAQRLEGTDLGLLVTASGSPPFITLRPAELCLAPPEPGDEVFALGFHSSRTTPLDAPETYIWDESPALCRGNVLEVFHLGRDTVMAPYPCFSVQLDAFGGMSGGPVFNVEGKVLGVISSAISDSEYALAALVWPLLSLNVAQEIRELGYPRTVYEAVLHSQILAEGILRVQAEFGPDGLITRVSLLEKPL